MFCLMKHGINVYAERNLNAMDAYREKCWKSFLTPGNLLAGISYRDSWTIDTPVSDFDEADF